MVTAFGFFMLGGALAEIIRAQLFSPESRLVSPGTYNEIFTMHGSIMMYLFIVPFAIGLANYLVPLQIGAREMAFPRLNALGYWLYLFGGLTMVSGFLTADGAGGVRLDRLRAAVERHPLARRWVATCGSWPSCSPAWPACWPRSTSWRRSRRCGPLACRCSGCRSSPGTCS